MRIRRRTGVTAAAILLALAGGAHAQGFASYSCFQLWKERNSIYKAAGYCFRTERARRYFGNEGCVSSDTYALPLSGADRANVAAIQRLERERGCAE